MQYYPPLGIKSEYSSKKSIIRLDHLAIFLKKHGIRLAGIIDRDFTGHFDFYTLMIKKGIIPALGLECLYYQNNIFIYARTKKGYIELINLYNNYFDHRKNITVIPFEYSFSDDLLIISEIVIDSLKNHPFFYHGIKNHDNFKSEKNQIFFKISRYFAEEDHDYFEKYSGIKCISCSVLTEVSNDFLYNNTDSLINYFSFNMDDFIKENKFKYSKSISNQKYINSFNSILHKDIDKTEYKYLIDNNLIPVLILNYKLNSFLKNKGFFFPSLSGKLKFFKSSHIINDEREIINIDLNPFIHEREFNFFIPSYLSEELLDYIYQSFIDDNLVSSISLVHYKFYQSKREVGKTLDIPYYLTDKLARNSNFNTSAISKEKKDKFYRFFNIFNGMFHYQSSSKKSFFFSSNIIIPKYRKEKILITSYANNVLDTINIPRINIKTLKILDIIFSCTTLRQKRHSFKIDFAKFDYNDEH